MKTGIGRQLDPNRRSQAVEDFERALRHKIIGQDAAVDAVVDIFQMFTAGLNAPNKPVGNLLFLGPTGTGKTHVLEVMAEALFGDEHALIKVDCAEFQHSHEISKLIGSPPGYLGHRETHPIFTQEAINQWHTDKLRLTLILFDEIEKASDALWQLQLGILDKGTLTLGDNHRVDMSCCIIAMSSNIGATEMSTLTDGGLGFTSANIGQVDSSLDEKIQKTAIEAAKRKFSPEFMNRVDKSVVFKTLRQGHLEQILELELESVQQRILRASGNSQFIFTCSDEVKKYLLREGTDPKYGARHLKRIIERSLVFPLSNLVATNQICIGDGIRVSLDSNNEFIFTVEAENALLPVLLAKYGDMGLKTAATLPPLISEEEEDFAPIKRAQKEVKAAEEKLSKAQQRRRQLDEILKLEE